MRLSVKSHNGKTGLYYLRKRLAHLSSITGLIHLTAYTCAIECTETARKYAEKHGLIK